MSGKDGAEGAAVVAALTAAVDDLLSLPLTGLALVELAVLVETQTRRLPGFDHALIGELNAHAVAAELGARNTASVLVAALRLSPAEASARVRAAKELGPRVDLTGAPMPPLHPDVAAAQARGGISAGHARVITATVADLPTALRGVHEQPLEGFLVEQSLSHAPDHVVASRGTRSPSSTPTAPLPTTPTSNAGAD